MLPEVELKASDAPDGQFHASAHGAGRFWSVGHECSLLLFVCNHPARLWLVPLRSGVFPRTPPFSAQGSFAEDVPADDAPSMALAMPRINVPLARFTRVFGPWRVGATSVSVGLVFRAYVADRRRFGRDPTPAELQAWLP